jgi:hypothetical protein
MLRHKVNRQRSWPAWSGALKGAGGAYRWVRRTDDDGRRNHAGSGGGCGIVDLLVKVGQRRCWRTRRI